MNTKRARMGLILALCWSLSDVSAGTESNSQAEPNEPGKRPAATKATIDACALLTDADIEAVQGEGVAQTKASEQHDTLLSSQCFYRLATFTKSVSLTLTTSDPANPAPGPRELWKKTFHENVSEGDTPGQKNAEKPPKQNKEEREDEASKPRAVAGVGEEAHWVGNRVTGALYVLKGNAFLRISIGGSDDESVKIKKSKTLAQKALTRFSRL